MSQIAATFIAGIFKPDERPSLPDQTRVQLTIETVAEYTPSSAKAAWDAIQARLLVRPIDGGGVRFTRDQLHVY